jgi:hypothetical protein
LSPHTIVSSAISLNPNSEGESSDNDSGIKGMQRKQGMRPSSKKSRNPALLSATSLRDRPISSVQSRVPTHRQPLTIDFSSSNTD